MFNNRFIRATTPPAGTVYYGGNITNNPYYSFNGSMFIETSPDGLNWTGVTPNGAPVYSNTTGIHDSTLFHNPVDGFWYAFCTHQPADFSVPANDFLVLRTTNQVPNAGWVQWATPAMTNDGTSVIWVPRPLRYNGTNYVYFSIGPTITPRFLWITTCNSNFTTFSTPSLFVTNESTSAANAVNDPFFLGTTNGSNYLIAQELGGNNHYDLYGAPTNTFPTQLHLVTTNVVQFNCEAGGVCQVQPGLYQFYGCSLDSLGEPVTAYSTSFLGPWSTAIFATNEYPFVTFPHGSSVQAFNPVHVIPDNTLSTNVPLLNANNNVFGPIITTLSASGFGPNFRLTTGGAGHDYYLGSALGSDTIGVGKLFIYDNTYSRFVTKWDTNGNIVNLGGYTATTGDLVASAGGLTISGNATMGANANTFAAASGFGPNFRLTTDGGGHSYYIGTAGASDGFGLGRFFIYDATASRVVLQITTNTAGPVLIESGLSTQNTNQFAVAATGWTNTNAFNCVMYITAATAATFTYSDGTNTIFTDTGLTFTTAESFIMHPSYKVVVSSGTITGVAIVQ